MLLYHGTTDKFLPSILEKGIQPRKLSKIKGNWAHTIQSANDRIYLTDAYAPYFAESAAGEQGGDPIVFVIDPDKLHNKLVPDEDAAEQIDRIANRKKIGKFTNKVMLARTRRFREDAEYLEDQGIFTYEDSLNYLGTCAVIGTVDREAILGYYTLRKGKSWQVWDPSITPLNYNFMKSFYRYASEVAWQGKSDLPLSEIDKPRWHGRNPDAVINELIVERKVLNEPRTSNDPTQLPANGSS